MKSRQTKLDCTTRPELATGGPSVSGIERRECPVGPEDAAVFLKVARSTVMSLARAGRIPAHPVTNGSRKRWLFFLSELESHIRALGVNCGSHPCAL
jgi:hypothetical protein